MLVTCSHCNSRLQLDGNKVPAQVTKARCPKCGGSVEIKSSGVAPANDSDMSLPLDMTPPALHISPFERPPAAAPFKASEAKAEAPRSSDDALALLVDLLRQKDGVAAKSGGQVRPAWDRRKVLVCTEPSIREAVAEKLAHDHEVYVAHNTSEALGRMRENRMDVLVVDAGFDPIEQGFAFVMREIKLMRPAERRRLFLVLMTANARTMDLHAAFLHNANLVVNPVDVDKLPEALEVSLRHYNELYRDFNRVLELAPI